MKIFRKKIILYIILSYSISWLIWLPNLIAFYSDSRVNNWLHLLGGLGPMLAAFLTSYISGRWEEIIAFIRERFISNFSLKWVFVSIL